MKYMVVWWLLSNPFQVFHGPCVDAASAHAAMFMKMLAGDAERYHYEVQPCETKNEKKIKT